MLEDHGQWRLAKPLLSFEIWKLWKSTGYQMPLWGTKGVLEWPDWFREDALLLNWINTMVRRDMGLKEE